MYHHHHRNSMEVVVRQYLVEADGRKLLLQDDDTARTFIDDLARNDDLHATGNEHPGDNQLYRGMRSDSYVTQLAQVLAAWKETSRHPLLELPDVPMVGVTEDKSSLLRVLGIPLEMVVHVDSVASMDSFITAIGGARGILTLLGVRCTVGSAVVCPPTRAQCLEAFNRRQSSDSKSSILTIGARQWTKHVQRSLNGWWGVNKGSEAAKNAVAECMIVQLLDSTVWKNIHGLPNGPVVFEIRQHEGYGARWSIQGGKGVHFRGFVEPYFENGHDVGWMH
ncbi:hypothetical protein DYB26_016120 [Aphanomyces astaci]|uniref:Uncharacterized protein n=1 Tax=Aphanomyces astaci TaxID=112090 RepID=A0A397EGX8_APHAT|nr:hypothetical protein DYB34_001421 [Aphanomyces astaci]RHY87664.1 hypothetical protein DYB31_005902 [Aphanomyces astaci]RHZ11337.1 hypothetical protein DYB26_016120 [Aphanomyces astaci]